MRAIFSLILALLLWGWVTNLDDPEKDITFNNLAPVVTQPGNNLVVLNEGKIPTVNVIVRGPRSVIDTIAATNIQLTLNLENITQPGSTQVPVTATIPGYRAVRVQTMTPAIITITVDRLTAKTFPLEVDKGPSIPPYSIGNVDYNNRTVAVRGPASLVAKVARVVLPVALGDHRDGFDAQIVPEARATDGSKVSGVTIEPGSVAVTVAIERIGRTVSIVPNLQGTPAEGYRISNTNVAPPAVTVDGPPDVLAQLIIVSTTPINVNSRREPFSVYNVSLVLPAGTRLIDRTTVNVEIQIEAEQQRQPIGGLRVIPNAPDPGLRVVSITPPEITITISGPLERLRQLSVSDIRVDVDVRGKGPGVYTLTPQITMPPGLRYDPPPTVQVQIDRLATPTITPTRPPTPTPPVPAPSGDWWPIDRPRVTLIG